MERNANAVRWFVVCPTDRRRLNAVKRHFAQETVYATITMTSKRALDLARRGNRPEVVLIDHKFPVGERPGFVSEMRKLLGSDDSLLIVQTVLTRSSAQTSHN
jgi:hypothetical protein